MADFEWCYQKTLDIEGGYVLDSIPNDRGGWTYAGISRNHHPDWPGWELIDMGKTPAPELVMDFYEGEFWKRLRLDYVLSNTVAWPIYDHAVTSGYVRSVRMAQEVLGIKIDGIFGERTLAAINSVECAHFKDQFAFSRIRYYLAIARRDRTQRGHLLSWITRSIAGV